MNIRIGSGWINKVIPRLAKPDYKMSTLLGTRCHHIRMYLPEDNLQLSLTELSADISPEALPNVTKGITDVLELCQSAGFDQHGLGCGLSVLSILQRC